MLIDYHRRLAADRVRNERFYRALKRAIQPGVTRVADLGSGTGLLGFMAHALGASSTTLYEREIPLARLSEFLIHRNKLTRIVVFAEDSRMVFNPEPVELVVSETLGNLGLEEGIGDVLWDARRFLLPGGIRIPNALTLYVRPVGSVRLWTELDPWKENGLGLDLMPLTHLSRQNLYVRTLKASDFEGIPPARVWDRVDFGTRYRSRRQGRVEWRFEQTAWVFGYVLWWVADLIDGIVLSTAPDAPSTHWEQIFAPILEPIRLAPGEKLGLEINARFSERTGVDFEWTTHARGKVQYQSIRKGDLENPSARRNQIRKHRVKTKTRVRKPRP